MPARFPILLVDDEAAIADILNQAAQSSFPEATFFHVSSFREAASYLENLEGKGPKLILLDVNLQIGIDGLGFLSLIRNHPKGRFIPVVMLSSSNEASKIREIYELGASSFTRKPFSYQDWKEYLKTLRTYWFETVTIPTLWFDKEYDK